jgi:hypothetical protein
MHTVLYCIHYYLLLRSTPEYSGVHYSLLVLVYNSRLERLDSVVYENPNVHPRLEPWQRLRIMRSN